MATGDQYLPRPPEGPDAESLADLASRYEYLNERRLLGTTPGAVPLGPVEFLELVSAGAELARYYMSGPVVTAAADATSVEMVASIVGVDADIIRRIVAGFRHAKNITTNDA